MTTNKFVPYGRKMKNGFFLIASNELPMCSNLNHLCYKTEWEPFESRCVVVSIEEDQVER